MTSDRVDGLPADPEPVTTAMRLQILSTEHWSLLASRGLAWNESFTRVGTYLSTLSFSLVALALVGQATDFGEAFRLFSLIVLPVVLLLGIGTQLRLDSANHHDVVCILGMNRIRAKYLELAPDLAPLFVMGTTDDFAGVVRTMAVVPGRSPLANVVSATPVQVAVLNAVLFGAVVGLVALQLGAGPVSTVAVGAIGAVGLAALFAYLDQRMLRRIMVGHRPLFPSLDEGAATE
jgi:hypothetical protein